VYGCPARGRPGRRPARATGSGAAAGRRLAADDRMPLPSPVCAPRRAARRPRAAVHTGGPGVSSDRGPGRGVPPRGRPRSRTPL